MKTLHVLGAVLLLGNVTVTGLWALYLFRHRSRVPWKPVARAIMWADLVFTVGGGTLLTVTGILLAMRGGYRVAATPWLRHGIAALALSTLLWLMILVPDQFRMERLPEGDPRLGRIFLRWNLVGWLSTLLLYAGLWAMVSRT